MVIQATMAPEAIVSIWEVTAAIFKKYSIPLTKQALAEVVEVQQLPLLIQELNTVIGSSASTCIAGG